MSEVPYFDVALYATRRLQNPDATGEHEHSLRSLAWSGHAPSAKAAVSKAQKHLRIALAVIGKMTDRRFDAAEFHVDHTVEEAGIDGWVSIRLGEVVSEQIEARRPMKKRRLRKDYYDMRAVLGSALKCLLADHGPKQGVRHALAASVHEDDHDVALFEREVDISYCLWAGDDLERTPAPDAIAALQVAAAAYRLADEAQDLDDRTEATFDVPESATLAAAVIAGLRQERDANGALAARFLRSFGLEEEALAFEGAGGSAAR